MNFAILTFGTSLSGNEPQTQADGLGLRSSRFHRDTVLNGIFQKEKLL